MANFHSKLVKFIVFSLVFTIIGCGIEGGKPGKTLRVGNGAEPQSIDPHKCTGHPGIRVIGALFEGLVLRDPKTGNVLPGIAKSWDLAEHGTLYTFHLRKSRWSDGTPLTAHDFVYSWRRLLDPSTGAEYASLLNILRMGDEVLRGAYPPDSLSISAPNDSTFVVRLTNPTGYFLQLCAFEPLFPVPRHAIEKHGDQWTSPEFILSNGPFVLKTWAPNKNMLLAKNPNYWDASAVKQPQVEIFPTEHQETAYKMFLNRELDWIFSIPLSKMEAARKKPGYVNTTQYGVYYYSLNMTRPEFKSKAFRKALSFAVDRKKIVQFVTKGGETAAKGFVPTIPSIPYPGAQRELYNPDSARYYMKAAGFGAGRKPPTLEILYNNSEGHKKIAEVVTQMWREVLGVDVGLHNMEWKIYLQKTKNKEHIIARASWIADYPDPYSFLELGVSTNGNNRSGYSSPDYDACISRSQTQTDREERFRILTECEKILMDDMPVIPLYYYAINELRHPDLKGAPLNPMGMYPWKYVHLANNKD